MWIIELIESKPILSADVRSPLARTLLPDLLRATPADERSRAALEMLKS